MLSEEERDLDAELQNQEVIEECEIFTRADWEEKCKD